MKLPNYRYEEIKRTVAEMFLLTDARSIPINISNIAKKLHIDLIAYSSLSSIGKEACLKQSTSGFMLLVEHKGVPEQRIYYNDSMSRGRLRFTLLHEIGHIYLHHYQESEIAEAEANFFAKYAIAPPSLVYLTKPSDYMDIAEAFCLSSECALYSWNYYQCWLRISDYKDYEYALISLFTTRTLGKNGIELRLKRGA